MWEQDDGESKGVEVRPEEKTLETGVGEASREAGADPPIRDAGSGSGVRAGGVHRPDLRAIRREWRYNLCH